MTTETTEATEADETTSGGAETETEVPAGTPEEQRLAETKASATASVDAAAEEVVNSTEIAAATEAGKMARRNGETLEKVNDRAPGSRAHAAFEEGFKAEDAAIAEAAKSARDAAPDGD